MPLLDPCLAIRLLPISPSPKKIPLLGRCSLRRKSRSTHKPPDTATNADVSTQHVRPSPPLSSSQPDLVMQAPPLLSPPLQSPTNTAPPDLSLLMRRSPTRRSSFFLAINSSKVPLKSRSLPPQGTAGQDTALPEGEPHDTTTCLENSASAILQVGLDVSLQCLVFANLYTI